MEKEGREEFDETESRVLCQRRIVNYHGLWFSFFFFNSIQIIYHKEFEILIVITIHYRLCNVKFQKDKILLNIHNICKLEYLIFLRCKFRTNLDKTLIEKRQIITLFFNWI